MPEKHIGIIGTHGTGKTTYARKRFQEFSVESRQVSLISGVARACPFRVERPTTESAQLWIFHTHMLQELSALEGSTHIVCDRTVLDNLAYSEAAGFSGIVDRYLPAALDWMDKYTEILWFHPTPGRLVKDGFRDTDPAFQLEIHTILSHWITTYAIPVRVWRVDEWH